MKHVRIELHVTAFIHVGDDLTEGLPPEGVPFHREDFTITRTAPVGFTVSVPTVAQQHTASVLASVASVLPAKLAHGASKLPA